MDECLQIKRQYNKKAYILTLQSCMTDIRFHHAFLHYVGVLSAAIVMFNKTHLKICAKQCYQQYRFYGILYGIVFEILCLI